MQNAFQMINSSETIKSHSGTALYEQGHCQGE